uniref:Ionotropic glutamate receptor C-terminal domain-containing protein n=1 Tax=Glossina austeni TaxID=7395 RepID=A0A1A9UEZ6_GLOAU
MELVAELEKHKQSSTLPKRKNSPACCIAIAPEQLIRSTLNILQSIVNDSAVNADIFMVEAPAVTSPCCPLNGEHIAKPRNNNLYALQVSTSSIDEKSHRPHYEVKTIATTYFANLTSVLIVYDSNYRLSTCNDYDAVNNFCLQELYLNAIQQAFDQQTQRGHVIGLQWIDIRSMNSTQYEEVILNAVNVVTEGFITILTNTTAFLHAHYSAARNARLRLKDKYYLFLCEHEDSMEFRGNGLLQFSELVYPHHVMVVPSNINSNEVNYENKQNKTDRIYKPQNLVKQTSWSSGKVTFKRTTTTKAILTTTKQTAAINSNFVFTDCKSCSVRWYRDINFVLWTQKFAGTAGNLNAKHLDTYVASERSFAKKHSTLSRQTFKSTRTYDTNGSLTYVPYVVTNYVGFITVLTNTTAFLHARYSATRNARLRLKDKYYLFLCEHENPVEFLGNELLQFYPHHLMVVPSSKNSNYEIKQNKADRIPKARNVVKQTSWSSGNATIKTTSIVTTTEGTSAFRNCKQCSVHRNFNFELWTQKYVGTAGNLDAKHLDTYVASERTFLKNTELYPDKLTKLQGRTLRMGSHTYVPYTATNYVPPGTGNVDAIDSQAPKRTVSFIGSEAELIISFCQNYDCHLRVQPYGENAWGDVYDNGTGVGMFGGLFAQHIECAIGSMYDWYHDLYEVSHEIAATTIKFVTPGPAQYPRWRIIIMPFSLKAWIVIALAIFLYSLIFQFIKYIGYRLRQTRSLQKDKYKYVKHFLKTLLDVFAVFIQQPSADTSLNRFASRVCLAALLFATLTLENTYSGQLKSFLTTPLFTDPVDTMDKWTKTNWKWTAPSMEWIINIEHSDLVKDQILTQKFEMNDLDFLYNASFRDDYGLGIEGLFSGSFTFDALYYAWTVAAGVRGWPLIPLLNRHISHCFETGLYIHWEKEAAAQILDRHTHDVLGKLAAGYKPNFPPQKLTVETFIRTDSSFTALPEERVFSCAVTKIRAVTLEITSRYKNEKNTV